MDIPVTQLPPGDPRLVEAIVGQLKSKGIFDQFRKECLSDVDTKPAFQNLRQRVEGHVNKFLEKKIWKNDMNKNQLRDGVRKHVNSLGILDSGIDAIITQVVNPKIKPLILPYVEDTVYAFLQIDKPKRGRNDSDLEASPVPLKEEEMEEKKIKPEEITEAKPPLLPMETDVISSEEDDILARESPEGDKKSASSPESDVAIDENARDGFEDCPQFQEDTPEDIATNVERLHLSEDDSKSAQAAKPPLPLFDDQSLDSISSNSSGLTFSPLTDKGSPESKKSLENTPKSEDNSKVDARSATSTPLVDEKPVDESSQSSLTSDPSKEFASSEKMYATDKMQGEHETSTASHSAISSSARSAKDGASVMSLDEEDSRESKESFSKTSRISEKSEVEEKPKSEKSEGEISSSGSEMSDVDSKHKPETTHSDEKNHSDYDSSHKSRSKSDHKKKHDSHSRDRDREREKDKDSRHHRDKERKHSKSRDDHHSHRDKDKKHHRRDKDHDGDKDRSRSHHHQSSSSHKESSGSSRSSGDRDKDRSSHHSSGKSSEGKSRSKQSGEKSEGKPSNKTETKSEDKVDGKCHSKDDSKHDKKSHGNSDRKSDSKSDARRDKRSEERTKENPDGKQEKTSEGKSESKSKRKTDEVDSKSHKSGRDSSSSKHKRTESSSQTIDSKKQKHSHRSKTGEKKDNLNEEMVKSTEKNVLCENLEEKENVHNGESTIDAHMLGFSSDNIIVADDEGNLMLLTYEDDTDSVSSECPTKVKSDDSSKSETLPSKKEVLDPNNFEGFENTKQDQRLTEYLRTAEKVPDDMDMEWSELFNESDLHITLFEDAIKETTTLSKFLKCVQQLGAVIKNEKGEIEDHSAKPIDSIEVKEKNASQIVKKRRISNSSSISSSSSSTGSPKHKRFRRESSAASDTSQMLEQDSVIVSGYALLTPEDDGNRSMGREYDLDYNQKMSNYSPLSPVSDSSADEGKPKTTGSALKPSVGVTKTSSKIDHKTEIWPNEEAKFSV